MRCNQSLVDGLGAAGSRIVKSEDGVEDTARFKEFAKELLRASPHDGSPLEVSEEYTESALPCDLQNVPARDVVHTATIRLRLVIIIWPGLGASLSESRDFRWL